MKFLGDYDMKKVLLSILDGVIVAMLAIFAFKLSWYISDKLYQTDYIQNILNSTDLNKLSTLDIFIGVDGGMFTVVISTLVILIITLNLYRLIRTKIQKIIIKYTVLNH